MPPFLTEHVGVPSYGALRHITSNCLI